MFMNRILQMFLFSRGHSVRENWINYLRAILLISPLVTLFFIAIQGDFDHLAARFAISLTISVVVATFCFAGSIGSKCILRWIQRMRGRSLKEMSIWTGVLLAYPFVLPGLYYGFKLAAVVSRSLGYSWESPRFSDYRLGLLFGILVSGLFALFQLIREGKEASQKAQTRLKDLENEKLKAQISALTAQMNPHLLFNSLNTIASTIETDPRSAEDMVVQLSELYRGILQSARGDMHSLAQEIQLCTSYLEIEKRRFGSRIGYEVRIEPGIDPASIQIPVLLLQPLIENSVKHGLSPKLEGGFITIDISRASSHYVIRVVDNGLGPNHVKAFVARGLGTGLVNCESRLKLKYGDDSVFQFFRSEENLTTALVHIPVSGEMASVVSS
jgi:sensor histidine kinase YesM